MVGTAGGHRGGTARIAAALPPPVGDRYYVIDAGHGVGPRIRQARLGDWTNDEQGPLDAMLALATREPASTPHQDLAARQCEG
ncbi:hypothetical protein ACH347_29830 [Saccharopolyspora sp. 5N102]|uniref:hypothetical protein n=1 Tax=Saccharopolyspora sp. 5N102 TaxID=3375155 RepID=UPI003798D769